MRNSIPFVLIVFVLGAGAWGADVSWTNADPCDDSWCTPGNWQDSAVPGPCDVAIINPPPEQGPIVGLGCSVDIGEIHGPKWNSNDNQIMDITGGTVVVGGDWQWGTSGNGTATINISGSPDISVLGWWWRGPDRGTGILNISGDPNIIVVGHLKQADSPGALGLVNIDGGTITVGGNWYLGEDGDSNVTISSGLINVSNNWTMQCREGSDCDVNISGGQLTFGGNIQMGAWFRNVTGTATLRFSDGSIDANSVEMASDTSTVAFLDMTGGSLTVMDELAVPKHASGIATINLHGGRIECGRFTHAAGYSMDITEGTLVIDGDEVVNIENDVGAGYITAYDGRGHVVANYNSGTNKTTVTAVADYEIAWNPYPSNGAENVLVWTNLNWSPGDGAISHDVYLGTSFDDVNSATSSSHPNVEYSHVDVNSYDPNGNLLYFTTYYWRVDEVNDSNTIRGRVWSFSTGFWDKAVYWDERYGGAVVATDEFEQAGYKVLDADQLKTWMDGHIVDNKPSVVVFCQLLIPDTVMESMSPDCTLRQYLNAGGKIVWFGDVPMYWQGHSDGSATEWGIDGSINVLGFNAAGGPWDEYVEVTFTEEGLEWGLTETWFSERPANPMGLRVLAEHDGGYAAAWVKHYVSDDTYRGFVRLFDTWGVGLPNLDDAKRAAEYIDLRVSNPSPGDGESDVIAAVELSWTSHYAVYSHEVYLGTNFNDVNDANSSSHPNVQYTKVDINRYDPPGLLEINTTYYWRVDEVIGRRSQKGQIWSFITGADCNGNGVADPDDVANGTSLDCNANGFPDECELGISTGLLGSLVAWGNDTYNQVSDAPIGDSFIGIFKGFVHAYALTTDGSIVSWGWDKYGQVSDTPGGNDFVDISGGQYHGVALHKDGYIVSWSRSLHVVMCGVVTDTPTESDFAAIAAGYGHSLALRNNGTVVSWGCDNGGVVTGTPTGSGFIAIDAGKEHSVALKDDGSIVSWGSDAYGQISNAPSDSDFIDVSAGEHHSLGLKVDGSIVSWGRDEFGQVSNTPGGNDFVDISGGQYHSVALHKDGYIVSWGRDDYGQVTDTPSGSTFTAISSGAAHILALDSSGDCNANGIPDEIDIGDGTSWDINDNGIPDECEAGTNDINKNGVPDECDDCNGNSISDPVDIENGTSLDCNGNLFPDECDIADGTSLDCNGNGVPDECDIADVTSLDCNANGVPDECDIADGNSFDCNGNGVPDECDIAEGTSTDVDTDGIPDECQIDVRIVPIAVLTDPASTSEVRTTLPDSMPAVVRGGTYYIEIWASDLGSTNTGLTSVYVDVSFCGQTSASGLEHGTIFTTFPSGTIQPGGVDEFGGSGLPSGIEPNWVRAGWIQMSADVDVETCTISLLPSSSGVGALERGLIPWVFVDLGLVELQITPPARSYNLDGDTFIGPGDWTYWIGSWLKTVPPADAEDDFDCDCFVGVGDLSWLATGWMKSTSDPTILYPPCPDPNCGGEMSARAANGDMMSTETGTLDTSTDVAFEVVVLDAQSGSDTTTTLPVSVDKITSGQTYYVEVWVSDVGDIDTGVTSAYVDLSFPGDVMSVVSISHGGIFTAVPTGSTGSGVIDELGGSILSEGIGVEPQWARVAVVQMHMDAASPFVLFTLSPSSTGVSSYGRGQIPWVDISLGSFIIAPPADLNKNGRVDFFDFSILGNQWRLAPGDPSADIAPVPPDGVVDWFDLAALVEYWLEGITP